MSDIAVKSSNIIQLNTLPDKNKRQKFSPAHKPIIVIQHLSDPEGSIESFERRKKPPNFSKQTGNLKIDDLTSEGTCITLFNTRMNKRANTLEAKKIVILGILIKYNYHRSLLTA